MTPPATPRTTAAADMPCFNCGTPWRVISAYREGRIEAAEAALAAARALLAHVYEGWDWGGDAEGAEDVDAFLRAHGTAQEEGE